MNQVASAVGEVAATPSLSLPPDHGGSVPASIASSMHVASETHDVMLTAATSPQGTSLFCRVAQARVRAASHLTAEGRGGTRLRCVRGASERHWIDEEEHGDHAEGESKSYEGLAPPPARAHLLQGGESSPHGRGCVLRLLDERSHGSRYQRLCRPRIRAESRTICKLKRSSPAPSHPCRVPMRWVRSVSSAVYHVQSAMIMCLGVDRRPGRTDSQVKAGYGRAEE